MCEVDYCTNIRRGDLRCKEKIMNSKQSKNEMKINCPEGGTEKNKTKTEKKNEKNNMDNLQVK